MNDLAPDELELDVPDEVALAHESGLDEATAAWARERGFRPSLPNTVVITKVRDPSGTCELFKAAYPPRYVRHNIEPFLARLPLRLELNWPEVALLIDALRTCMAFEYEVNP